MAYLRARSRPEPHHSRCHIPFLPGLRNICSLTCVQSRLSQALSSSIQLANLWWHLAQARQGIALSGKQSKPSPSPVESSTPLAPLPPPPLPPPSKPSLLLSVAYCLPFMSPSVSAKSYAPPVLSPSIFFLSFRLHPHFVSRNHSSVDEYLWIDAAIANWGIA